LTAALIQVLESTVKNGCFLISKGIWLHYRPHLEH
jgi:hypothetical protein